MLSYMQSYFTPLFLTVLTSVIGSARAECGRRPGFHDRVDRVIGGRNARLREVPWQVSIAHKRPPNSQRWPEFCCAGSIIHEKWILTAAHCFQLRSLRKNRTYVVLTGTIKAKNEEFGGDFNHHPNVQVIEVEHVIPHQYYNLVEDHEYDIALVKLKNPIRFDDFSQPICLPSSGENFESKVCQFSGWGGLGPGRGYSFHWLQVVELPIITNRECLRTIRKFYNTKLYDSNICALAPRGDIRETCRGDSGGPLVCRRSNQQFVQAGIMSMAPKRCGSKNPNPNIYTKISEYITWINCMTDLNFP